MSARPDSTQASSSANRSLVGETLAGCKLDALVNRGAMGTVYKGYDELMQAKVSVTVIHPRLLRVEGYTDRLRREIEEVIPLKVGPNASVLRYELLQPWLIVVSKFFGGQSLREILNAHGRLDLHRALWTAIQMFEGIGVAHDLQITHKDIKPENLMINGSPELAVVGWGLLRVINATTKESLSSYGNLYGTPEYMAPDQITQGHHDPRSDLYSAGITLFELVTGVQPFQGERIMEILKKQLVDVVPSARTYNPGCPPQLDELIQQLTAKDPARRPSHADEVVDRLKEILHELKLSPEIAPFALDETQMRKRETQRISPVTASALQALAERMQNSASLGMLAFEADDAEAGEMTMYMAPAPVTPANTQQLLSNALQGDIQQSLRAAMEQGKADKVVPELLEQLFKAQRYDELLNLEDFLKSILPSKPTVPYYVGLTLEVQGEFSDAADRFHETLGLAPHHLPASLHCARCLTELERTEEAEHVLRQATKMAPSSEVAAAKFAEFLFVVKGDAEAAVPAYQKAIRLAPDRLQLRKQLAWILMDLGRLERAEAVLDELKEWSGSGQMVAPLFEELKQRRAKQRETQAMARPPAAASEGGGLLAVEWPTPRRTQGLARASKWDSVRERFLNIPMPPPGRGRKSTSRSARQRPLVERIQRSLGSRDFRRAAELCHRGLRDDAKNLTLLLLLGRADFELGEYEEAIQVYRYALKIDPDNEEARSGLSAARLAKKKNL